MKHQALTIFIFQFLIAKVLAELLQDLHVQQIYPVPLPASGSKNLIWEDPGADKLIVITRTSQLWLAKGLSYWNADYTFNVDLRLDYTSDVFLLPLPQTSDSVSMAVSRYYIQWQSFFNISLGYDGRLTREKAGVYNTPFSYVIVPLSDGCWAEFANYGIGSFVKKNDASGSTIAVWDSFILYSNDRFLKMTEKPGTKDIYLLLYNSIADKIVGYTLSPTSSFISSFWLKCGDSDQIRSAEILSTNEALFLCEGNGETKLVKLDLTRFWTEELFLNETGLEIAGVDFSSQFVLYNDRKAIIFSRKLEILAQYSFPPGIQLLTVGLSKLSGYLLATAQVTQDMQFQGFDFTSGAFVLSLRYNSSAWKIDSGPMQPNDHSLPNEPASHTELILAVAISSPILLLLIMSMLLFKKIRVRMFLKSVKKSRQSLLEKEAKTGEQVQPAAEHRTNLDKEIQVFSRTAKTIVNNQKELSIPGYLLISSFAEYFRSTQTLYETKAVQITLASILKSEFFNIFPDESQVVIKQYCSKFEQSSSFQASKIFLQKL